VARPVDLAKSALRQLVQNGERVVGEEGAVGAGAESL